MKTCFSLEKKPKNQNSISILVEVNKKRYLAPRRERSELEYGKLKFTPLVKNSVEKTI